MRLIRFANEDVFATFLLATVTDHLMTAATFNTDDGPDAREGSPQKCQMNNKYMPESSIQGARSNSLNHAE